MSGGHDLDARRARAGTMTAAEGHRATSLDADSPIRVGHGAAHPHRGFSRRQRQAYILLSLGAWDGAASR